MAEVVTGLSGGAVVTQRRPDTVRDSHPEGVICPQSSERRMEEAEEQAKPGSQPGRGPEQRACGVTGTLV